MDIALVNMPFAAVQTPSLALTQLKAAIDRDLGNTVTTRVHYLNQEFALRFGVRRYQEIAINSEHMYSGIGDWLFRQIAFPELQDNADTYFMRYYRRASESEFKSFVQNARLELESFMESLILQYRLLDADIVGLSTTFAQTGGCLALARMLKSRRPEIITILGGANCEHPMGASWASAPQIDYVFSGPSLLSFPEFVRRRLRGDIRVDDISGVIAAGSVSAATPEPVTKAAGWQPMGEELPLSTLLPLDYDEFVRDTAAHLQGSGLRPILMFETSRGCWWGQKSHCTFCGLNGATMAYRAMPATLALEQIQSLFKYEGKVVRLQCVDNILPKEYLKDVIPHLNTPDSMVVFYEVKADLTAEDIALLAGAGVRVIQPGIEALNTSTLKLMRKGTSAFTNVRLLMNCGLHGARPYWAILVGFPGEEAPVYEKYLADIPSLYHLFPPGGTGPVRFDRFSPYFMQAEHYKLDLEPLDFYGLTYPFEEETIRGLAYYFADVNYGAPYIEAMASHIDQLRRAVEQWRRRYHGSDGGIPAGLYYIPGTDNSIVRDTRSGTPENIALEPEQVELLKFLVAPRRMSELEAVIFDGQCMPGAARRVEWLRDRRLVFVEGDRLMSLVQPKATHSLLEDDEARYPAQVPDEAEAIASLSTAAAAPSLVRA